MNRSEHKQTLKLDFEIFEPILTANEKNSIIQHRNAPNKASFSKSLFLENSPGSVIDKETLQLVQILELHQAIDFTQSSLGSAVLLRSLIQPSGNLEFIQSKQQALLELQSDDKLRQTLGDLVSEYQTCENTLFKFFNKGLNASLPYADFKKATKGIGGLVKRIRSLPPAKSKYLNQLILILTSSKQSTVVQMMNGRFYRTFKGLKSAEEVSMLTPRLKFVPQNITKWILPGPLIALASYLLPKIYPAVVLNPLTPLIGLVWTVAYFFYSFFIKPIKDVEGFIEPLRKSCIQESYFNRMIDAIGMIDELQSHLLFAEKLKIQSTMPNLTNGKHHFFKASVLRNPVLAMQNPQFIPNDISLKDSRLTFLTGPNSGGKTTICKSIIQNQLLAQAGSYVVAKAAEINLADNIRYQAPKFDALHDDEGRFGTELKRTRDIFYTSTPKSLIVLDELAEGSTVEESLHHSTGILKDFHTIGNNTLMVTHNHSQVDWFKKESLGQALMVEFKENKPTYKIKPGISRMSHADKVARRINFSAEDREAHLREKGYLT